MCQHDLFMKFITKGQSQAYIQPLVFILLAVCLLLHSSHQFFATIEATLYDHLTSSSAGGNIRKITFFHSLPLLFLPPFHLCRSSVHLLMSLSLSSYLHKNKKCARSRFYISLQRRWAPVQILFKPHLEAFVHNIHSI